MVRSPLFSLMSGFDRSLFSGALKAVFLLVALCYTPPVHGQDNPGGTPADPAATAPAVEADAKTDDANEKLKTVDHLIYIPYERLSDVIDRFKSKVVISYSEYLELLRKAEAKPPQKEEIAVIANARYVAEVKGETVAIQAKFKCRSLKERWGSVSFKLADAAVGKVTAAGGKQVLLQAEKDGVYRLLFPEAGEYDLTLDLLKKVSQSPAGPTLNLSVPATPITIFELKVPKASQKIFISPRHIEVPLEQEKDPKSTQVAVSLGAVENISASWVPDTSDRPEMDLLSTVTNDLHLHIGDGLIHTGAKLNYEVLRGELAEVRISVPKDQRILDLTSSSRLQGWTVAQEETAQIITAQFLSPVTGKCTIEVHAERSIPKEAISLAGLSEAGVASGIHALDVTREQGHLRVSHSEDLSLVVISQAGLLRDDKGGKEAREWSYRYFTPKFDFKARVEPVQPVVDVRQDSIIEFRERRIDMTVQAVHTITKAGVFQLQWKLDPAFEFLGVSCANMTENQYDKASQTLTVVLKEQTLGQVQTTIRGRIALPEGYADTGAASLENLPQILPQSVRQDEGRFIIGTIEAIEVIAAQDDTSNVQQIPLNEVNLSTAGIQWRAAWKYQSRPVEIPVQLIRRPTRLSAQTASSIHVLPSGIQVSSQVDFVVQYAGIDTFQIAVPRQFESQIEIEIVNSNSVPIQQKRATQNDELGEKWSLWTIQTQRPVTGRQQFQLKFDIPLADDENGEGEEQVPEEILLPHPLGGARSQSDLVELTRSTGEIVVQSDPALSVSATGSGAGIERIDVRELTTLSKVGQQAYRYPIQSLEDPIRVALTVKRYEVAEVVSTVISRLMTEYVVGASSELATRAQFVIRTSQRQRLALQLPESAQPMVVQVDGQTRQLQRGEAAKTPGWVNYLVNVSRTKDSEESFHLMVHYLTKTKPLTSSALRSELDLAVPRIVNDQEQSAVVQETRCVLWMPREYVPVHVTKPFERWQRTYYCTFSRGIQDETSSVSQHQDWLQVAPPATTFPTDGLAYSFIAIGSADSLRVSYWSRSGSTALLSIVLLVIGLVLVKTAWENRILVVIVVGTLLAAAYQWYPELIIQLTNSARYGVFAVGAVWIVHGVFQCWHCCFKSAPSLTQLETSSDENAESAEEIEEEVAESPPDVSQDDDNDQEVQS